MRPLTDADIDAAERFVWCSGRLLDRRRFAHLFHGGPASAVVDALRPYANPDGGFGGGLEPDLRGPSSQPQPVEVAFRLLHEVGGFADPMVTAACDWLVSATRPGGGAPFVLPSVRTEPRAPWWDTGDDPPGSLNPTAALAGLLHAHGVEHPWLAPATAFCWAGIESLDHVESYELRCVLLFLEHAPDRERAERAIGRLGRLAEASDLVAPPAIGPDGTPEDESHRALDFVPTPDAIGRRLFSGEAIARDLEALREGQREDGGWTVDFPTWTPMAGLEWRAHATIEALVTLRAHAS